VCVCVFCRACVLQYADFGRLSPAAQRDWEVLLQWLYGVRNCLERAAVKYRTRSKLREEAFHNLYAVVQNALEDMFYFNLPLTERRPGTDYLDNMPSEERRTFIDWLVMIMEQAVIRICWHLERPEDFDNMYFHTHALLRGLSFRPKDLDGVSAHVTYLDGRYGVHVEESRRFEPDCSGCVRA